MHDLQVTISASRWNAELDAHASKSFEWRYVSNGDRFD